MIRHRTQVAIVGSGPAGMLLSELLSRSGIESVVLERQSRAHVASRIRAGVLESTTVDVLRANGLSERMDREGHPHDGMRIVWAGRDTFFIDTQRFLGRRFMTYGQTQIQEDLYAAADRRGQPLFDEVQDVALHELQSSAPHVSFTRHGVAEHIDCELVDRLRRLSRRVAPRDPAHACCASSRRCTPSAGSA